MDLQTPMQKIVAFHHIKNYLNKEQQQNIIEILGLNQTDLEKRLWGKDNEVEFILMIDLLQWCENILAFEEGVAKLTNTVTSDLLIELKKGQKIAIEIKSTEKDFFKISKSMLEKKESFANSLGAELYFAVKINGYWTLYSSNYIKKNGDKIKLVDNYYNSELNKIFGNRTFIFPSGLIINSKYSKSATETFDIEFDKYGKLIEYEIKFKDKVLLQTTAGAKTNEGNDWCIFAFEALHDVMSNDKQKINFIDSDKTIITEELTKNAVINLYNFVLAPIKHTINLDGDMYDFNGYLSELIDKKNELTNIRKIILMALSLLAKKDYPIEELIDLKSNVLFKNMIIEN